MLQPKQHASKPQKNLREGKEGGKFLFVLASPISSVFMTCVPKHNLDEYE